MFAATVADHANADTVAAQYLYDHFTQPQTAPTASPAPTATAASDTVEVSLRPALYLTNAKLRYTTDGSAVTASSPAYNGRLVVSKNTTVKVAAVGPDGKAGPTETFTYRVNDTTAPRVTEVSAMAGSPVMVVHFSEPVNGVASAARYSLSNGLSVANATAGEDGRSARLTVSPAPSTGTAYTLTVDGVTDRSPAANVVASAPVRIALAEPAFRLTLDEAGKPVVSGVAGQARVTGSPEVIIEPQGAVLSFNGRTDSLDIPNDPALNPTDALTVTAWVKPASWAGGNRRVLQKGRNDSQYRLSSEAGRLLFEIAGVGEVTAPLPSTGQWHFLAGTYDGREMRLYVDGAAAASATMHGAIPTTRDGLHIGTKEADAPQSDHFRGEIEEVRVYGTALPAEYIRTLSSR